MSEAKSGSTPPLAEIHVFCRGAQTNGAGIGPASVAWMSAARPRYPRAVVPHVAALTELHHAVE